MTDPYVAALPEAALASVTVAWAVWPGKAYTLKHSKEAE